MHDAYEETLILNISVQIESMAAYGRNHITLKLKIFNPKYIILCGYI